MAVNEGLVEKLMNEDEAFRKAFNTHREFQKRVEEMEKKHHLSNEEIIEKKRLKKLKLALKDEMETIISMHGV